MCLASFASHNVFKVHPCCSMYQYVIPYCWLILHFICVLRFIYTTTCWWPFGYFHSGTTMTNAAMDICVLQVLCRCMFLSFGYGPRSGIAGSFGNSVLTCGTCQTVFHRGTPFNIPTSSVWGFWFFHHLTNSHTYWSFLLHPCKWAWRSISLWFRFPFPWWLITSLVFARTEKSVEFGRFSSLYLQSLSIRCSLRPSSSELFLILSNILSYFS